MIRTFFTHALPLAAVAVFAVGCNDPAAETDEHAGETAAEHAAHEEEGHAHEHAVHGPHDGEFVDLGDHEYLAELVHDAEAVTIYLYDHDGKTPVPTEAKEITINLMHDGQPEQFKLAASPTESDPEGKSSRFTLKEAELAGHLDEEAAAPKLMVTINGTPYTAPLAHDHEGHDHGHEGHAHGEEGHEHAE